MPLHSPKPRPEIRSIPLTKLVKLRILARDQTRNPQNAVTDREIADTDASNVTFGIPRLVDNNTGTTIYSEGRPYFKLNEASGLGIKQKMKTTTTRGWTVENLVSKGKRMKPIPRVSAITDYDRLDTIIKQYEDSGIPLIIEDWNKTPNWPTDGLFSPEWLLDHGEQDINVRNCVNLADKTIAFSEFVERCRTIPEYVQEGETERFYGKDAVCPSQWKGWLMESNIPSMLKPGSSEDVLELLPESERVETLMCYHGIGDTFTAAHKDLCASSGHNLMCNTERGGSAFWFMTQSNDAPHAVSYFHDKLNSDLDHECYVAGPEEFARAPFIVYVAEQCLGDLDDYNRP
ncbi:hypothetical protein PNOK_0108200 [Pyrrhoderma noxium]|uniref:Uncharacterized protein n=1 Tax=Pyrrhoderma noxium TaxID=2282107 RepID=A0A286UWV3_9AGAM|nr:hypothetical protein PNOK_0108200 [Pyrrhoderma noxium]